MILKWRRTVSRMALAALCGMTMISSSNGQTWIDPSTGPVIVQDAFGDYGQNMPGFGEQYCYPTSAVMSILWLQQNGFTQLGLGTTPFTNQNTPAVENLERLMAGLMNTSVSGGTPNINSAATGLENYLDAAGLSGLYTYDINDDPTIAWMSSELARNQGANSGSITFVNYNITWYDQDGTSNCFTSIGGHTMELLSVSGSDETGTITIHNPEPSTMLDVQDAPQNSFQTIGLAPVPAQWKGLDLSVSNTDYVQLETPIVGGTNIKKAIMDYAYAWSVDSSGLPASSSYAIQTWELNTGTTTTINTNGATFDVIAPIADGTGGPAGFDKTGLGTMVLENSDAATGTNVVKEGMLASTYTGGAMFGEGSISVRGNAGISFQPSGSGALVSLQLASGSGSSLSVGYAATGSVFPGNVGVGAGTISVIDGAHASSTLFIGGNTDGVTPNITVSGDSTLVLAVTSGSAGLGSTDKIIVAGSGGNLPSNNAYGIVDPSIVGQNNDVNQSGYFVSYDAGNGFAAAAAVSANINSAVAQVFDATTGQTVSEPGASVGALQVDNVVVSGGPLSVGSGNAGDESGVILNSGSISTAMNFGAAQANIYTSLMGGSILSGIMGTGGLVTFGPGDLIVSGSNGSSLSGGVYINSGTLTASGNQSTGSGAVTVASAATLAVNAGATVSGNVEVETDGVLLLSGGTVTGSVVTQSVGTETANTGGILQGYGVISGSANIEGPIQPGPTMGTLTFTGSATLGGLYYWNLASLTSNADGTAGTDWNLTTFDSYTYIDVDMYVEFSSMDTGPNSDDVFWDTTQEWTLFEFGGTSTGWSNDDDLFIENSSFADGTFSAITSLTGNEILIFTPVPEPPVFGLAVLGALILFAFRRRLFA